MKTWIQIRVDIPDGMDPERQRQVEDNIHFQKLRFLDSLRRVLPHSVGVSDADLSPVEPKE